MRPERRRTLPITNPMGYLALQSMRGAYRAYPYAKYAAAAGAAYLAKRYYRSGKNLKVVKYKKKPISRVKKNTKRITFLNKKINNNEATILHRSRIFNAEKTAAVNQCKYSSFDGLTKTLIEDAISQLKYFDPSAPATLTVVDYNTGTFNKQILLSCSTKIKFRNNYKARVNVVCYLCKIRSDTNQSPESAIVSGFADIGPLDETDMLSKATDSKILKDLWIVKKVFDGILEPGQMKTYSHYEKPFSYDTSLVDTHALEYVKIFKSNAWLIRIQGVLVHNNFLPDVVGTSNVGVDVYTDTNIVVKYDAGIDLFEIQTVNNAGALTSSATQTTLSLDQTQFSL